MISFRQHTHWQKYGLNAQSSTKGGRVLKENPRGCLTFTICIKKLLPLGCLPYQFNEGFQVTTFYSNYWPQHLTTKLVVDTISWVLWWWNFESGFIKKILHSRLLISTFKRAWLLNNIHQSNTYFKFNWLILSIENVRSTWQLWPFMKKNILKKWKLLCCFLLRSLEPMMK